MEQQMQVTKRNGQQEDVSFDKILTRLRNLSTNIQPILNISYAPLVMKVVDQFHDGISTNMIDELVAEQCASMSTTKVDYGDLAARIVVSNHQKSTSNSFSATMTLLFNFIDHNEKKSPLISTDLYNTVCKNETRLNAAIDYNRDFLIDYFGFKTLERAYLMRVGDKVVERPQHMWMRVSLGIHGNDIEKAIETYNLMSHKYFTHATPTLFNAGTPRPQLSSCIFWLWSQILLKVYTTH